jgi:starch synthase
MEFFGQLNLLKTGLVFADAISTVSPTYAREIQGEEQGSRLDGVLRERAGALSGILNGIDTDAWNPATDQHIAQHYTVDNWEAGKAANKAALQRELGLQSSARTPVIGLVGRIASQKGLSLVLPVMNQWLGNVDAQWAILGSGEKDIEQALLDLERRWPGRVAVRIGFSDPLAHRIEAGADLFLMPSRYEPCGLNQMYSMAYGTVPVVRQTGGLADTVFDPAHSQPGSPPPTGFHFVPMRHEYLEQTLARALIAWSTNRPLWNHLVENGMRRDWSWKASAGKYCQLYQALIESKR